MAGKHVPGLVFEERGRELLDVVRELRTSAAGLIGDAEELVTEDAAELTTVDEAVRTSSGRGGCDRRSTRLGA